MSAITARIRRSTEHNLDEKGTRDVLGGALRPNDPRRFLVEAMVGAIHADGVVDPRELEVLERHLIEHDLFQGVSDQAAQTMITLARDALAFAGSPAARTPAIARGLPSRIHRLTAYAMACEVVKADGDVASTEMAYLDVLRQQLRVGAHEAVAIFAALDERRLPTYLDERVRQIRGLVPQAAELFALRALVLGRLDDTQRELVLALFCAIPDLAAPTAEIDRHLRERFFQRPRGGGGGFQAHLELKKLADELADPVDRWWLTVYALAAEPPPARPWRQVLFAGLVQYAFGLNDHDMDLAAHDAPMVA